MSCTLPNVFWVFFLVFFFWRGGLLRKGPEAAEPLLCTHKQLTIGAHLSPAAHTDQAENREETRVEIGDLDSI
jgi:hypothetical protein